MGHLWATAWEAFRYEWRAQSQWMEVNFILAVIPAALTFLLHHYGHYLGRLRWIGVVVVALMLPNAPYVVTDLIHVPMMLRGATNVADLVVGVAPLLITLLAAGVLSYAYTLHVFRRELRWKGWSRRDRILASACVDLMCAVGVALGRISRLNSWDAFRPFTLLHGLGLVVLDPRSVVLALVIVLVAGFGVDWVVSGAAHTVRDRVRHR